MENTFSTLSIIIATVLLLTACSAQEDGDSTSAASSTVRQIIDATRGLESFHLSVVNVSALDNATSHLEIDYVAPRTIRTLSFASSGGQAVETILADERFYLRVCQTAESCEPWTVIEDVETGRDSVPDSYTEWPLVALELATNLVSVGQPVDDTMELTGRVNPLRVTLEAELRSLGFGLKGNECSGQVLIMPGPDSVATLTFPSPTCVETSQHWVDDQLEDYDQDPVPIHVWYSVSSHRLVRVKTTMAEVSSADGHATESAVTFSYSMFNQAQITVPDGTGG